MPLAFLFDENIPRSLRGAVWNHNRLSPYFIDMVAVGEPADLPRGTDDPTILLWAERENRVVVTGDERTMPGFLAKHLQTGNHSPGLFIVRRGRGASDVTFHLALVAHASDVWEWQDCIEYIP